METKPSALESTPMGHRHTPFRRFNKGTRKAWGVDRSELESLIKAETDPYQKAGLIRGWALTSDNEKAKEETGKLQDKLQASEEALKPSELKFWLEKLLYTAGFAAGGTALLKAESLLGSVDDFKSETKKVNKRLGLDEVKWRPSDNYLRSSYLIRDNPDKIRAYPSKGNIGYQGGLASARKGAEKLLKTPLARHFNLLNKGLPLAAAGAVIGSNSPKIEENAPYIIGGSLLPLAATELGAGLKGAKTVKSLRPFLPALATLTTGGALSALSAQKRQKEDEQFKKETKETINEYLTKFINETGR